MKQTNFSKKELEEICLKEGIILERNDIVSNSVFYLPNLSKIKIMVREFDFLVEGASRGKAINEISKIEMYLFEHEGQPDLQTNLLATKYSHTSIFLESKSRLIEDKDSDNWSSFFIQHFSLEDIYNYFHKTEGASNYFKKFKIYEEMVELKYKMKFMEYLQSQIEVFIPIDDDKIMPYKIDSIEMTILILKKMGMLDTMKNKMKDDYYINGAKFLNTLLGRSSASWKIINEILWDMDNNEDGSILKDATLESNLRDVLYHYKIDLR